MNPWIGQWASPVWGPLVDFLARLGKIHQVGVRNFDLEMIPTSFFRCLMQFADFFRHMAPQFLPVKTPIFRLWIFIGLIFSILFAAIFHLGVELPPESLHCMCVSGGDT